MSKFVIGACLGFAGVQGLPEDQWKTVQPFYRSVVEGYKETINTLYYYRPSEINRRKSEEIKKTKNFMFVKEFQVIEDRGDERAGGWSRIYSARVGMTRALGCYSGRPGPSPQLRGGVVRRPPSRPQVNSGYSEYSEYGSRARANIRPTCHSLPPGV